MLFDRKNPSKPKNLAVKFIYNFLSLQKQSQLGNTLAVGLGLGLIAVAGTTTSLMKASQDKTNVVSNEQTQQAMAGAESGITRIQNFLANNPQLALVDWFDSNGNQRSFTQIEQDINTLGMDVGACSSSSSSSSSKGSFTLTDSQKTEISSFHQDWQSVGNDTQTRLVAFEGGKIDGNAAKVTVQGRKTNSNAPARTEIQVEIPITKGTPLPKDDSATVPGLWIGDDGNDWAKDKVNGDIKIASCDQLKDISGAPTTDNLSDPAHQRLYADPEPMPDTPSLPAAYTTLTGSMSNMTLPRNWVPETPARAEVLATPDRTETKRLCKNEKKQTDCQNVTTTIPGTPFIPAVPAVPAHSTTDNPDNGVYHYLVDQLDLSGGGNLNIVEGAKVVLYVKGNISLSGNPDINPNANNTSKNLQIYGNTYTGTNTTKYGCDSLTLGTNCPTLEAHFNGTGTMKAFVHAPDAVGSVNGGGNANGNFKGSMWIKAWDSSSGNSKVKIDAVGTYGDYLGSNQRSEIEQPRTNTISNWSRKEVSQN